MSRVSAVTEAVEGLLAGLAAQERGAADPDGLLHAATRALLSVAQRFEGRELLVSVGPEHAVAVRIRDDGAGPTLELVAGPDAVASTRQAPARSAPAPEPAVPTPRSSAEPAPALTEPQPDVAAELADLLRRRVEAQW
jgi:hypothetical protein